MRRKWSLFLISGLLLLSCPKVGRTQGIPPTPSIGCASQFLCFDYSNFNVPIAGVAGGNAVGFVGKPLNGSVVVLLTATGQAIAPLPPPPNGLVLPLLIPS